MTSCSSQILTLFTENIFIVDLSKYQSTNDFFYEKVLDLKNRSKNKKTQGWRCETFSTIDPKIYNLINEPVFLPILSDIEKNVLSYANNYGVNQGKIISKEAWINLSKPGDYQEFHSHALSHFSIAYYVKVPENSGEIIFRSPRCQQDMFPLPVSGNNINNITEYPIKPKNNMLLIFRSYFEHMVEKNQSFSDRVSISGNFILG